MNIYFAMAIKATLRPAERSTTLKLRGGGPFIPRFRASTHYEAAQYAGETHDVQFLGLPETDQVFEMGVTEKRLHVSREDIYCYRHNPTGEEIWIFSKGTT